MFQPLRSEILKTFRRKVAAGEPIIGGGAGTGLSAKCAEAGGIDLIIIYNSGRYRMAGHGSLAGPDALRRRQRDHHGDGARGAPSGRAHSRARQGLRDRPVPGDGTVPGRGQECGVFRRPELPHRRFDRRQLPPGAGRDGDGLRQGSGDDRHRARDGPLDLPICPATWTRPAERWPRPGPVPSSRTWA